jgi:hypothetical protein
MAFTDEILAAALLLVYLFDGVHWLQRGEAAVEWRKGGVRRIAFGATWTLAGRRPWLPRPFGTSLAFRAAWSLRDVLPGHSGPDLTRAEALQLPARLSAANAVLVAALAPVCLVSGWQQYFLFAVAGSVLLTLATGVLAYARRHHLGCTAAQVLGTTAIAIVCLPCGGNLARAFAQRPQGVISLPAWALSHVAPADRRQTLAAIREELETERSYADEKSERAAAVRQALAQLEEVAP